MTTIDEITIAVKQFINDYTLGLAYPIPTEPYVEPAEQPSEPKGMNFDCFSISIRVCSQWTLRFLNVFVLFHFYLLLVIAHFNLSILHSLFCFDQKNEIHFQMSSNRDYFSILTDHSWFSFHVILLFFWHDPFALSLFLEQNMNPLVKMFPGLGSYVDSMIIWLSFPFSLENFVVWYLWHVPDRWQLTSSQSTPTQRSFRRAGKVLERTVMRSDMRILRLSMTM